MALQSAVEGRDTDIINVGDRSMLTAFASGLSILGIAPDPSQTAIAPDGTGVVPLIIGYRVPLASVPTTVGSQFQWMQQANSLLAAATRRQIGYNSDSSETSFLFTEVSMEFIDGTPGANSYTPLQIQTLLQSYAVGLGSGNNQRFISAQEAGRAGPNRALNGATTVAATTLSSTGTTGAFGDGGVAILEGSGFFVRPKNDSVSCQVECLRTHGITIQGDVYITLKGVGWLGGPINTTNNTGAENPCSGQVTTLGAFRRSVSDRLRNTVAARAFRSAGLKG